MLKWKSHVFTTMAKRPPACRAHDLRNNRNKSYAKKHIVLNWLEMIFCNQLIIYGYWLEGRNEQHYFLIVFWSWQVPSATIPSNRKSQLKCIACYSSSTYILPTTSYELCIYTPYLLYSFTLFVIL